MPETVSAEENIAYFFKFFTIRAILFDRMKTAKLKLNNFYTCTHDLSRKYRVFFSEEDQTLTLDFEYFGGKTENGDFTSTLKVERKAILSLSSLHFTYKSTTWELGDKRAKEVSQNLTVTRDESNSYAIKGNCSAAEFLESFQRALSHCPDEIYLLVPDFDRNLKPSEKSQTYCLGHFKPAKAAEAVPSSVTEEDASGFVLI